MSGPTPKQHSAAPRGGDTSAAPTGATLRQEAARWRGRIAEGQLGPDLRGEASRLAELLEQAADALAPEAALDAAAPARPYAARQADALARSEERFRLLVDSVREYAIYMLDPSGRVASWNTGAERIHGYRAAEIIGRPLAALYPADASSPERTTNELETALRAGRYEEEGWRARKDGSLFWANVVLTPVRDAQDRLVGFAKVTRDMTERRRAEDALRQSEQTFRLLVQGVRDYAIFMLDTRGVITSWNAGAQNLKGYRAEEALGQHFSKFYTQADRDRGHPDDELRRAVADGVYQEEGWRVRKDGTTFWASVVITALYDPAGRHVGFAKITRDMTERRKAEEALRRMNENLQQQVRQQTAATKEVEAFSYSVSHDLRAPLRALDGFSKLLIEQAGERLEPQERDYLRRIREGSQQMSQLIDAMLYLSRLTRTPVEIKPVDVTALCRAITAELARADPDRRVELVIAEGLSADGDPRLLRVIWENLLRNAWKFSRKQPAARIEVGAVTQGGERVFFVRDNGAGIDMSQAHRLFLPFQRLHRAKEFEGTGVGLATVHRIVQLHDGRIWVDSEPGKVTTFFFTIGHIDAAT